MSLFEIDKDNNIRVLPEVLMIHEFRVLYNRDSSAGKQKAYNELAYVYFMCDYKSNYASYEDADRHVEACKDAGLPTDFIPDTVVKNAIKKYIERRDTEALLTLISGKIGLRKIREHFQTVDLKEVDEKGKLLYRASDIVNQLSNLDKVFTSLDNLEMKIRKQESINNRQKGGREVSEYEDPAMLNSIIGSSEPVRNLDNDDNL